MNRYQFLQEFLDALGPLSEEEKQQISDYYEELICDGLEQGLSEEEVLARFGSPQDEARRCLLYTSTWRSFPCRPMEAVCLPPPFRESL